MTEVLDRRRTLFAMIATTCTIALAPGGVAAAVIKDEQDKRDALTVVLDDLIAGGRILANENAIDAFGHISSRHPLRPGHFLMSRARAPGLTEQQDIMEFDAAGTPVDANGRHPYIERYIHAAIYEARPDVRSVVHDHSPELVPFSVSTTKLRALAHTGGMIGETVPVWDIADRFGTATNLLVTNLDIGRDLAKRLGKQSAVLMRGHGVAAAAPSIRLATYMAISLNNQARMQRDAMALGSPKFLAPGEVAATAKIFDPLTPGDAIGRTWEYWCVRAAVPFHVRGA